MAIKVQGTTVIDDSRNLQNLGNLNTTGNVYANTFVGDASQLTNLPASGGTYEATASGTLSDGSTVVVNADGTVSVVAQTTVAGSTGTAVTYLSGYSTSGQYEAVYDPNNQKVIIASRGSSSTSNVGAVRVGTVSGGSISFGSEVIFDSNYAADIGMTYDENQQKVFIAYRGQSNYLYGIVGTVSGTSISFGSRVTADSNAFALEVQSLYDPSSQKIAIVYGDHAGATQLRSIVATVSGTSVSFGTRQQVYVGSLKHPRLGYDPDTAQLIVAYRNPSFRGATRVGTISGTTLSFGTEIIFDSTYGEQFQVEYDTDQNKIVIMHENGSNRGAGIVGTVTSGSISFGTAVEFTTALPDHMVAVYDSNAKKVVAVYENQTTGYGEVVAGTVSGTTITFDSIFALNGTVGVMGQSGYTWGMAYDTASKKFVVAYRKTSDGLSLASVGQPLSIESNLTSENFIGISDGAYANNTTATIQIKGAVDDAQSGLTPGQQYFVQANGSINTTAADPSVFAGTAIASNKLIVKG